MGSRPPPEQAGNFAGIDFVILALATMNSPHVQGMAQDKRNLLINPEISQPVPGEHAFGTNNNIIKVWIYGS